MILYWLVQSPSPSSYICFDWKREGLSRSFDFAFCSRASFGNGWGGGVRGGGGGAFRFRPACRSALFRAWFRLGILWNFIFESGFAGVFFFFRRGITIGFSSSEPSSSHDSLSDSLNSSRTGWGVDFHRLSGSRWDISKLPLPSFCPDCKITSNSHF